MSSLIFHQYTQSLAHILFFLFFFNSFVAKVELVQYIPPHALRDDHLEAFGQNAVFNAECIAERSKRPDGAW